MASLRGGKAGFEGIKLGLGGSMFDMTRVLAYYDFDAMHFQARCEPSRKGFAPECIHYIPFSYLVKPDRMPCEGGGATTLRRTGSGTFRCFDYILFACSV